ncbi:MAG TPA: sulfotransferase [Pirellulaceae bacterium]|nr:sulfotransferase [Pirellulaceae bacterium]
MRSLAPGLCNLRLFREVQCHVLFIGHGRSGSSLVGSLLNAHRHALISHELNELHFIKRNFTGAQLNWLLYAQDRAFEQAGREWTGYNYRVEGQWQGKFEKILVIGDKHAGGATRLIGQRPWLLDRLRRTVGVTVKMVHVVRHPLDNIATLHRRQDLSLEAAAQQYFEQASTNERLVREYPSDVLTVHLEDVIGRPRVQMTRLCEFLKLDAPADFLEACAAAVFAEPRRTRDLIEWPRELVTDILRQCREMPFLHRYRPDIAGFVQPVQPVRVESWPVRRAA